MRILVVTQMWPGPGAPDLGAFVAQVVDRHRAQGHEVDVVAIDHRGGGRSKYARLLAGAVRAARRGRPEVVFAHMLFPAGAAGLAAARAARAPLVVMAHGTDVENARRSAVLRRLTETVLRGSSGVIANSGWLAARMPAAGPPPAIIDCGVDTAAFSPDAPREPVPWDGEHPRFLCIGALIERKNVLGLADAFAALGRGSLAFVGDGELRGALEGRPGVTLAGRVPHARVADWIAAADVVCQPSLREPFGQAALEGLAMGRPVVASAEGGPAEFVPPEAGVLVDPHDPAALRAALERAAALPVPNPGAVAAAAEHDADLQAERMAAVLRRAIAAHPRRVSS